MTLTAKLKPKTKGAAGIVALLSRGSVVYAAVRETGPADASTPRLRDRIRGAIRVGHDSRRTEKAYVHWIKRYILFHGKGRPVEMGAAEVSRFLTFLAVGGSASV